jgi:uncharacterized membrane-anchored protein
MNFFRYKLNFLLIGVFIFSGFPANGQTPDEKQKQLIAELKQMKWYKNTTLDLPTSHGKYILTDGYLAVLGNDAKRIEELSNGKSNQQSDVEAVQVSKDFSNEIHLDYNDSGYVDEKDWTDINPDKLLEEIRYNSIEQNKNRKSAGIDELYVDKWLRKPTYDAENHTVYWAMQISESSGGKIVNSTAIKLGRHGYERLLLIINQNDYAASGQILAEGLKSFSFPEGGRYEDHAPGDKVAGYGVAALVGALVGAKALKIAAAGGLIAFFKPMIAFLAVLAGKAWALLLLPFIWVKSLFKKQTRPKTQSPLALPATFDEVRHDGDNSNTPHFSDPSEPS